MSLSTVTSLLAVLVLGWAVYRVVLYPRYFSPLRHVPGPPVGHPIYGQFGEILRSEAGVIQLEWAKKYGKVVRAVGPIGVERLIFLDPEALHKILVSDWAAYPRPTFLRNTMEVVAGRGLMSAVGEEHKRMRKAMTPAFALPNLIAQVEMYYEPLEGLVEILDQQIKEKGNSEEKVICLYPWLSKTSLDIICLTAFGTRTDSLHNSDHPLAKAYHEITALQTGLNLSLLLPLVLIPGFTTFVRSRLGRSISGVFRLNKLTSPLTTLIDNMGIARDVSSAMLQDKIKEMSDGPQYESSYKKDIISILLRAREAARDPLAKKEKDGNSAQYTLSDEEMVDQALLFLVAGHETVAATISWALWLLASHQEAQTRLRQELAPVFDQSSRPSYADLKDLPWLDGVVQEALRLYPATPMSFRVSAKTDSIDGILVPRGTMLYMPIRVFNTWKDYWGEDAEEFNPARWQSLPQSMKGAFGGSGMLSFLTGPQSCIGKSMAVIEMKAVLAFLVVHFNFSPSYEGQVPHPTAAVTMIPKDNMPLRVSRVQRSQHFAQ